MKSMLKLFYIDSDRIADYNIKPMDIDSDTLGIPERDTSWTYGRMCAPVASIFEICH